jgi:diguanylate cyclase (GGDEF)-like protein
LASDIQVLFRADRADQSRLDASDVLFTFHDPGVFDVLITNSLTALSQTDHGPCTLIVDLETYTVHRDLLEAVPNNRVYIVSRPDESVEFSHADTTSEIYTTAIEIDERVVCLMSDVLQLAAYRQADCEVPPGEENIGAWTFRSKTIEKLLALLPDVKAPPATDAKTHFPANATLMGNIIRYYDTHQHHAAMTQNDLSKILEILKSLSVRRRTHDILYIFVEQIAANIAMDRCSVVRIWEGDNEGHVLASHEDESIHDVVIQLDKYPEINNTLQTGQQTLITDTATDPLTQPVAEDLKNAGITSIVVVPIVLFNSNVGTFLLRAARRNSTFEQREVEFCQIVAETAANAIERADLLETLQKTNRRLEHLATTDSLTGLYNRRYFRTRMEDEFARSKRYGSPLCCMMLDIDDFKAINDTYGHLQGDSVLRELSDRILKTVRASDIVARYGGEELIVILPQTTMDGATIYAERLLEKISAESYAGLPSDQKVTVSIGIAMMDVKTCETTNDLIQSADTALYHAKHQGKNRIIVGE